MSFVFNPKRVLRLFFVFDDSEDKKRKRRSAAASPFKIGFGRAYVSWRFSGFDGGF